jgi:hypothetical protein
MHSSICAMIHDGLWVGGEACTGLHIILVP